MAQESLKLAAFLFHHRLRCTLGWGIIKVHEETVCKLKDKKKLKCKYKEPDMLPKVNKADMMYTQEAIKEYFRLHCGVKMASLACIIRKTIVIETYGT